MISEQKSYILDSPPKKLVILKIETPFLGAKCESSWRWSSICLSRSHPPSTNISRRGCVSYCEFCQRPPSGIARVAKIKHGPDDQSNHPISLSLLLFLGNCWILPAGETVNSRSKEGEESYFLGGNVRVDVLFSVLIPTPSRTRRFWQLKNFVILHSISCKNGQKMLSTLREIQVSSFLLLLPKNVTILSLLIDCRGVNGLVFPFLKAPFFFSLSHRNSPALRRRYSFFLFFFSSHVLRSGLFGVALATVCTTESSRRETGPARRETYLFFPFCRRAHLAQSAGRQTALSACVAFGTRHPHAGFGIHVRTPTSRLDEFGILLFEDGKVLLRLPIPDAVTGKHQVHLF